MSKFSERFRQLKDENKLTLKELSEALEISIPNLSYYMKDREPNYDTLIKISDYFNVSIDWLVGRINVRNSNNYNLSSELEDLSALPLSEDCLEKYFELQEMMEDVLDNVHFLLYRHDNNVFLQDFYKKFRMIFLAFQYGIRTYIYPFVNPHQIKDNILQYISDTDLISDTLHIIMIMCSYSYADYMADCCDGLSEDDIRIIKEIISFTQKQFKEKYPDDKIKEMFEKMNML